MKLWQKIFLAVVLVIVFLSLVFKPVIGEYIEELFKTIEHSEYSPTDYPGIIR